ncbi:MAG TPA: CPBP family intramembrane glutamic endopeptidase [Polyangiaceae bacterium]|nr:CPBP family intramembrane glutamic endopeptidase [Polyangiaceae bacterium]
MNLRWLPGGTPAPSWVPRGGATPLAALLWTAAAYAAFHLLISLLALRGTSPDLVSLGAAEALAYTAVMLLVLYRHDSGSSLRAALGLRPTHPGLGLVGIGLGASLKLPVESLTLVVERFFPTDDAQLVARSLLYRTETLPDVARLLAVSCLMAPLVEELFFRGALFGRLVKTGVLGAALTTGIAFVLVHSDPRHWPALLLVTAVLSYLRAIGGSLLPCLGLHVAFNAAGVLALVSGAASPTRAMQVPWAWLGASWLGSGLLFGLALRLAESESAAAARAEDQA